MDKPESITDLTYEDAQIGFEFTPYVFHVTRDLVDRLADLLEEDLPVFRDPSAAKEAGYPDIVSVPILMNCYAHFIAIMDAAGYRRPGESFHSRSGFKFIAPVYPGDTITSKMKVVDKWVKRDHQYVAFQIESLNQDGILVAEKYHASVWPSEATVRQGT
jgi:acyl dehydratase